MRTSDVGSTPTRGARRQRSLVSTNPHTDRVTAIVLAAGAGTRMKSARAKVLHEVGGRSMIEHALIAVSGAGVSTTVAVIGHDRDQVSSAIDDFDPRVVRAVQDEQRGTGHAVQIALDALDEPPEGTVLVTYGDVPLLSAQTLSELLIDRSEEHTSELQSHSDLVCRLL